MKLKIDVLSASPRILFLGCAVSMVTSAFGEKPRAGSPESELALQEGILEGVTSRLARKKEELEVFQRYQEVANEMSKISQELEKIKRQMSDLTERKVIAGDKQSAVQLAFEDYRNQYRKSERLAAKGEVLDLSETKGAGYAESKVLGISPLHLRVARPSGTEGIPFKDLPDDLQDRFQFDYEEAARYAASLAKSDAARAKAYREWKQDSQKTSEQKEGGTIEEQLARAEELSAKARKVQEEKRKLSDEWRAKAARYWRSIGEARDGSAREGREKLASQAEGKADELMEMSKVARMEASRIDGEILELKRQVSQAEKAERSKKAKEMKELRAAEQLKAIEAERARSRETEEEAEPAEK